MTVLPIVMRELQVASRRRATFQIRFLGATGAAILGGLFLLATSLPGALAPDGRGLFLTLTLVSLVMALVSGPVLTADCLSREKREGTLGFLFLTDLSGWDVVAGKFVALSCIPAQGVLAVFPIVAMSWLLGGVTAGEFWRVLLVVVNAAFVSLALGMWISSRVTEDRRAVWETVLWAFGVAGLPLLAGRLLDGVPGSGAWSDVSVLSPLGLFDHALDERYAVRAAPYWVGMGIHFLAGAMGLGMAAWRVSRSWRQAGEDRVPGEARSGTRPRWVPRWWWRSVEARKARLRGYGNLAWLGWQGGWVGRLIWGVVGITVTAASVAFGMALLRQPFAGESTTGWVMATGMLMLKVLLAAHSVSFLHEIGRNGMLELLLVTPVTGSRMWAGHVAAVRGRFVWPFLVLAGVHLGLAVGGRLAMGGDWPSRTVQLLSALVPAALGLAVHALDLVAVTYHSARWALHYDRPGKALFRTILLVLVLPGILCSYGRFVIDLLVIASTASTVDRFRELARGWFVPRSSGGPPQPPRWEPRRF